MRTHSLLPLALLGLIAPLSAQTTGYNTFIRQTQQLTSVVWDMPVSTVTGNTPSMASLDNGGALFQLYTVKTTGSPSYMLDQKLVGAYLPTATVKITTPDPYTKEICTRADRGFTVTIDVKGLMSPGTGIPEAATKVLVRRNATPYPASGILTFAQATAGVPLSNSYLAKSGESQTTYGVSAINEDFSKSYGEEHFVVHALADGAITQSQIAAGYVRVFPTADGSIQGLSEGSKIGMVAPTLTLPLKNLYPRSTTWLRIYPGPYVQGKEGETVQVPLTREGNSPYTDTLTIRGWEDAMKEDGVYTIELVTQTAFDQKPIHLDKITYTLDRTIKVQATLVDMN